MKPQLVVSLLLLALVPAMSIAREKSTLLAKPPKGAVILFNGRNADQWHHRDSNEKCRWEIEHGNLIVKPGTPDLVTNQEFGDYQLHVEFWLPLLPKETSQSRANSGVYNHGRYEVQVLDSYHNSTYQFGGCGAIYGLKDPDVNAIIPPEQWNTYDITFRAPRFDKDNKVTENPRITVLHNGIMIHNNVEITIPFTTAGMDGPQPAKGPIMLQDHHWPIRYRNIWIVPIGR